MYVKFFLIVIFFIFLIFLKPLFSSDFFQKEINKINANVIFLRHSWAPSFGDQENFKIDDCRTQWNFSYQGLLQSRKIGKLLLINQIQFSEILTSEWFRFKDNNK